MERSRIVAVVVTYNPDDISGLLAVLSEQCEAVVVVDNGSRHCEQVRRLCEEAESTYIGLAENLGIAAAQNIGIEWARSNGASHVLLMDHDSLPAPDMVALLGEALDSDSTLGAVGPLAAEDREGGDELVYIAREWKPGRASAEELENERVEVAFLIASGCLIRMDVLDDIGGMKEELFIDHVDLEWGLRARNAGWKLAAVPAARLHHELGDDVVLLPGRSQPIHVHSPIRNYYLTRNTLWLSRQGNLAPVKWRIRYVWWLAKYIGFNAFVPDIVGTSDSRSSAPERWRMLASGVRDGIRGRMGRKG
ncbi:MAG: glycosyltransferase family 2 protein [Actinomycetaceae bacterium]|nr:glycosyltransferase family 2 protein [Actinomycetaceae bacterium]